MEKDVNNIIAERLSIARKEAGLSQGQVAKLLLMHRPTISEIEAGRRSVTAKELTVFAELYGVNIEWLTNTSSDKSDLKNEKIILAARGLSNLKEKDLEKVINLLKALKKL